MTDQNQEILKEIRDDVKAIWKILNGNGELGLVAKVSNHEKYIDSLRSTINRAIFYIVIVAGLGGMVGVIINRSLHV